MPPTTPPNKADTAPQQEARPATWVLLRGLTRETGHWGDFPMHLQAALRSGTRLVCLDLPGNGTLHAQPSPTTVADMAEAVRQQLREQGLLPPFHVLAMSLGAMVTVAWAAHHPEELSAAVLVNTSLRPHSPFWQRLRPSCYPRILGLLLRRASGEAWESAILQLTTRHPPDGPGLLRHWRSLRQRHPVDTANGLRQLWAAARYRAPATAPRVPLLLLNGAGDQLVHPACSATLASRWACALAVHPSAGHDLPQDDGGWVIAQIGHWLSDQAQGGGSTESVAPAPDAAPGDGVTT
jgi:pimeloyl-ACP methyl ester carboxylesterase